MAAASPDGDATANAMVATWCSFDAQVRTASVNGSSMRITATSAGVAVHFAWQHDRPHVWDGLKQETCVRCAA